MVFQRMNCHEKAESTEKGAGHYDTFEKWVKTTLPSRINRAAKPQRKCKVKDAKYEMQNEISQTFCTSYFSLCILHSTGRLEIRAEISVLGDNSKKSSNRSGGLETTIATPRSHAFQNSAGDSSGDSIPAAGGGLLASFGEGDEFAVMLCDELFHALELCFGHHVDVQTKRVNAKREHSRIGQKLRDKNQAMLDGRIRSESIRDRREAKFSERTQGRSIERVRRSHERFALQAVFVKQSLASCELVELLAEWQSRKFTEPIDSHQAPLASFVDVLKTVLCDFPTAGLQLSHSDPKVSGELRVLTQLRILIVRNDADQRANAILIEDTSQPLEPRPIHVRRDVI